MTPWRRPKEPTPGSVPYTKRPPCTRCGGKGTVASYDQWERKHKITECPVCRGSGKR